MRRDERTFDPSEGEAEIEAIESQWTRIWEAQENIEARLKRVPWREDFRIMWPRIQTLPMGSRLLDGGCGLGEWTIWFSQHGYPTTGIDISRKTIGKLKEMHPGMDFQVGDIRSTGFPDNSFDGYFSLGTFEHFEEGFGPVVQEAFRVLKPGGLLFTSTPFDNLRIAFNAAVLAPYKMSKSGPKRFYQWRMTRSELAQVLVRGGFEVEDVRIIHKRQGLQRMLQHTFGLNPTTTLTRGLAALSSPFVPAVVFGHMIMAIAKKPLKIEA
jgi:SAM-dependent methyltransferase